jgi:hypothetical protein
VEAWVLEEFDAIVEAVLKVKHIELYYGWLLKFDVAEGLGSQHRLAVKYS